MRALVLLAAMASVVLTVLVYRSVYAAEAGRYAGAEPAAAAILVAAPFAALNLAQASCLLATYLASTRRGRIMWACTSLVLAGGSVVGGLVVL